MIKYRTFELITFIYIYIYILRWIYVATNYFEVMELHYHIGSTQLHVIKYRYVITKSNILIFLIADTMLL